MLSGEGTLIGTRKYLVDNGISESTADNLARTYISKLESNSTSHVCTFIDLFTSNGSPAKAESLKKLTQTPIRNVFINYMT